MSLSSLSEHGERPSVHRNVLGRSKKAEHKKYDGQEQDADLAGTARPQHLIDAGRQVQHEESYEILRRNQPRLPPTDPLGINGIDYRSPEQLHAKWPIYEAKNGLVWIAHLENSKCMDDYMQLLFNVTILWDITFLAWSKYGMLDPMPSGMPWRMYKNIKRNILNVSPS